VSGIFVLDSESDPYDPAAVRASMGSLFSQKLTRCQPREFAEWAKARGVAVVGFVAGWAAGLQGPPVPMARAPGR
jgi:tRNA G18 (ribose-2'-O)-methylase SpoU